MNKRRYTLTDALVVWKPGEYRDGPGSMMAAGRTVFADTRSDPVVIECDALGFEADPESFKKSAQLFTPRRQRP